MSAIPPYSTTLRFATVPLVVLVAVAVIALEVSLLALGGTASHAFIYIASTGFVVLGACVGFRRGFYGYALFVALVCCWVGDVVGLSDFLWGVGAFLAAHLVIMAACLAQRPGLRTTFLALPVWAAIAIGLAFWLLPHVPDALRPPVLAYLTAITVMVTLATSTFVATRNGLLLAGAILFFISDIFVARWRFVTDGTLNILGTYPLYYTACVLLALSPLAMGQDRKARRERPTA